VPFLKESGLWWYTFTGSADYQYWQKVRNQTGGNLSIEINFFAKTDEEATSYVNNVIVPFYQRPNHVYKGIAFVRKGLYKSGWQGEELIEYTEVAL